MSSDASVCFFFVMPREGGGDETENHRGSAICRPALTIKITVV